MRLRTLLTATFVLFLLNATFGQKGAQNTAQPSKPSSLAQVWTFDATYTDRQHSVTFRYPSAWEPRTQFGYIPPALTASDEKPNAGFGYVEGGFPRDRVVGPYSATNLEGFGVVYSAISTANAAECEAKASSISETRKHRVVMLHGRSFSERETGGAGMSQDNYGKLYSTYVHHICYLFETDVAVLLVGVDDSVRALTSLQMRLIDTHLFDIMKSVRIVPPGPQNSQPPTIVPGRLPENSQSPSSSLPTVTSAAGAALVIVQDILRDSAYVSPRLHWGLFDNLQNLNRAAQAVSDDDGKDAAVSEAKEAAFSSALQRTIRNAETIGTRASETEDAKEKSYALAAKLRDVTYPHVTRGATQLRAQQPTPELNPCGDPMHGVELCLAISTLGKDAPPSTAVELPPLEMQLHNVGSNTVTYSLDVLSQGSAIEIDGIWHASGAYAGNFADQPGLVAGARSEIIRLSFQEFLVELDANRQAVFTNNLNLKPGQHSVRVRTLDVHDSSGQAITLVSNAITIDIPGVPAAMEKQALVDAVSIGGWTGLRAVPKLVEKYPDVALGAIEIGIRATPAELRDTYVIGAGLLPGDASAAFLKSQLAPTAGLHAQLRAAEALFARGDPEVVPAIIETWRSIQPLETASRSDAYSEAGAIINFLTKTGDIRAINALEENIRSASVDVRLALVQVFLPLPKNGSLVTGRTILVDGDIANLPAGEAGAAIERSLGAALDDKEQRFGLKGKYNDFAFEDPRVCDMAALVFSQRWPAKYQFHWSANIAERDSQIEVIRNTWRQEMGVTQDVRPVNTQVTPYHSLAEAEAGVEMELRITAVAPSQKLVTGDTTIYKWDQYGSYRILSRTGLYVINVQGESSATVEQAYKSLVQQLAAH